VRRDLVLSLVVLAGCSGPAARPDADSWPAPPLVSGAAPDHDTTSAFPAAEADDEAQPAVMFQCENGRLGAYVVPSGSGEGGLQGEQVPIILDSAPSC
jgi:hypothetical protein